MRWRKLHARDAPLVEYRAACGSGIGMCGYTEVPEDGRTCLLLECSAISSVKACQLHKFVSVTGSWQVDVIKNWRSSRLQRSGMFAYTGWAKKVIPLVQCNICTRGITFLAHPVVLYTATAVSWLVFFCMDALVSAMEQTQQRPVKDLWRKLFLWKRRSCLIFQRTAIVLNY